MKFIDPPMGWRFGFPRPIPEDVTDTVAWLIENGYPKSLVDAHGDHFFCRHWTEPDPPAPEGPDRVQTDAP